jgi:hypothetical protein
MLFFSFLLVVGKCPPRSRALAGECNLNGAVAPDPTMLSDAGGRAFKVTGAEPRLGGPDGDLEKLGELPDRQQGRETGAHPVVPEGQGDFFRREA